MGILVCQRCEETIDFFEDEKVSTRYTVCCTCQDEENASKESLGDR